MFVSQSYKSIENMAYFLSRHDRIKFNLNFSIDIKYFNLY
jgi:hypothetical protein